MEYVALDLCLFHGHSGTTQMYFCFGLLLQCTFTCSSQNLLLTFYASVMVLKLTSALEAHWCSRCNKEMAVARKQV